MTNESITKLLQQGEGIYIEFKTARFDLNKDTFDTICAFLNRMGGHLLFGLYREAFTGQILPGRRS